MIYITLVYSIKIPPGWYIHAKGSEALQPQLENVGKLQQRENMSWLHEMLDSLVSAVSITECLLQEPKINSLIQI